MTFSEALNLICQGETREPKKATRPEWGKEYILIKDDYLMIFNGEFHTFLIRTVDILAEDWIECTT